MNRFVRVFIIILIAFASSRAHSKQERLILDTSDPNKLLHQLYGQSKNDRNQNEWYSLKGRSVVWNQLPLSISFTKWKSNIDKTDKSAWECDDFSPIYSTWDGPEEQQYMLVGTSETGPNSANLKVKIQLKGGKYLTEILWKFIKENGVWHVDNFVGDGFIEGFRESISQCVNKKRN